MIDLDALEVRLDRLHPAAPEFAITSASNIRALIAELRARRKVVEAARLLVTACHVEPECGDVWATLAELDALK